MNHYLYRVSSCIQKKIGLLGLGLGLVSCASNSEEALFRSLNSHAIENLSHNQSEVLEVNEFLNEETELVSENLQFETPRRIQKQSAQTRGPDLDQESLRLSAEMAVRALFPQLDLQFTKSRNGLAFQYVEFDQYFESRRVQGGRLVLRIDRSGEWVTAHSTLVSQNVLMTMENSAQDRELSYLSLPIGSQVLREEKVIYPRVEDGVAKIYYARQLEVHSGRLNTAYYLWVDEETEEILAVFHPEHGLGAFDIYGSIHPDTPEDETESVKLPSVRIAVENQHFYSGVVTPKQLADFRGKLARISLDNPFLTVVNNGGDDNEMFIEIGSEVPESFDFDQHSSPEERNIYYWVMKTRQYLVEKLNFHEMDYQIIAMARDGMRMDNAYFNPIFGVLGQPVMGFGTGDRFLKNTALSRDIVLHEYGHAITHEIYGLQTSYEFRAMNEAMSDYLAATLTDDPAIADGAMMSRAYLRNVENTLHFERDFDGTYFHFDGQLFSGALWRIRKALGAELADRMIHEARLAQANTVRDFMAELLDIDEGLHDGDWRTPSPHRDVIRKSFFAHGLYSNVRFEQAKQEDLTKPWSLHDSNCWHLH